jgi:hypothetical protein
MLGRRFAGFCGKYPEKKRLRGGRDNNVQKQSMPS